MTARRRSLFFVSLGLGMAMLAGAQSGGPYSIPRSSVDSGGGRSSGGPFSVTGIIGQPDASVESASGGVFSLTGGFYASADVIPDPDLLFKDGFETP